MTDFGRRAGDMYKVVYDQDGNGIVDNSFKLDLRTLPEVRDHEPQAHLHTESQISDLDHIPNPHALGGAKHTAATLAQLNAKVSDANMDDSSVARTPLLHHGNHEDGGLDEIDCTGLVGAGGIATYGMRAILVGTQSVPTATWTLMELDTIDYDNFPGGSFNTTTHQWTCPTAGRYALALSGGFESALPSTTSIGVLMKKGGTLYGPYVRFCTGCTDFIRVAAADIQQIAQGAVYDMWIRHDYAGGLLLQTGVQYTNYLAIHRIG